MTEQKQMVKCDICGKPYVSYSHYAGDQSACPECRAEARMSSDANKEPPWRTTQIG